MEIISAQNQIQAEITTVESEDANTKIGLRLKSGQVLTSVITQEMELSEGSSVLVCIKSNDIMLGK